MMVLIYAALACLAIFVLGTMFIDDVVKHFGKPRPSPIPLPPGATIIEHDALVRLIGFGRAVAVTLGYTILVPSTFSLHSESEKRRIVAHEASHIHDRIRRGRLHLLIYLALYIRHGYANHPDELRADKVAADGFILTTWPPQ